MSKSLWGHGLTRMMSKGKGGIELSSGEKYAKGLVPNIIGILITIRRRGNTEL
jgi:hypothetical protein